MRGPIYPYTHQNLFSFPYFFPFFKIMALLTGMRWWLVVSFAFPFICISYVDHFYICLLGIWISCWKNVVGFFFFSFWLWSYKNSLYILNSNPSSNTGFGNIFSYFLGYVLILLFSLLCRNILVCSLTCLLFFLICAFGIIPNNNWDQRDEFFPLF